jgi:hypothetical protein
VVLRTPLIPLGQITNGPCLKCDSGFALISAHVIAFGLKKAREDQMSLVASDPDEYSLKVPYTGISDYLPIVKSLICKGSLML